MSQRPLANFVGGFGAGALAGAVSPTIDAAVLGVLAPVLGEQPMLLKAVSDGLQEGIIQAALPWVRGLMS